MSIEFWWLLILVGFIAGLLIPAFVIEVIAPRSRAWIRRLHNIERGKRAMGERQ